MPILAIVAILAALGGGVSIAAQSALPGSPLYAVKIDVNEPVMSALSFTDKGKAAFEAERAGRRLSEAEQLATTASVSADVTLQIQTNFKAFADRTQQRIDALSATDPQAAADLASNFETALRAHEKVLARLSASSSHLHDELSDLQSIVDGEVGDTVKARTSAEADLKKADHSPEAKTAAEGKLGAAANVIDSVTSYIASKSSQLGADAVVKANAQLTVAKGLMTQGQAKLTAGDYAGAFVLGNAAIRTAQEARALIELQDQLDVNLHLDGSPASESHPQETPDTQGYRESQHDVGGGRIDIETGF